MIDFADPFAILVIALLIDAVFGEPDAIWQRLPHPAILMGRAVDMFDNRFNAADLAGNDRKKRGLMAITLITSSALFLGWIAETALLTIPFGWLVIAMIASTLIAQRSLYDHVLAVAHGLDANGLDGGRRAVALIVGRDPDTLNEAGVSRAAIESTAENFSDGVVAPVFWFLVLGLGGLIACKVINTADSMIGHRTERHGDFGWASARLDDIVNWIPARITGVLIAVGCGISGGSIGQAFMAVHADSHKHRSPNAGWPEAAMAGGLGIALAGPRIYGERLTNDPFLNAAGRRDAHSDDIRKALRVLVAGCGLQALLATAAWLAF